MFKAIINGTERSILDSSNLKSLGYKNVGTITTDLDTFTTDYTQPPSYVYEGLIPYDAIIPGIDSSKYSKQVIILDKGTAPVIDNEDIKKYNIQDLIQLYINLGTAPEDLLYNITTKESGEEQEVIPLNNNNSGDLNINYPLYDSLGQPNSRSTEIIYSSPSPKGSDIKVKKFIELDIKASSKNIKIEPITDYLEQLETNNEIDLLKTIMNAMLLRLPVYYYYSDLLRDKLKVPFRMALSPYDPSQISLLYNVMRPMDEWPGSDAQVITVDYGWFKEIATPDYKTWALMNNLLRLKAFNKSYIRDSISQKTVSIKVSKTWNKIDYTYDLSSLDDFYDTEYYGGDLSALKFNTKTSLIKYNNDTLPNRDMKGLFESPDSSVSVAIDFLRSSTYPWGYFQGGGPSKPFKDLTTESRDFDNSVINPIKEMLLKSPWARNCQNKLYLTEPLAKDDPLDVYTKIAQQIFILYTVYTPVLILMVASIISTAITAGIIIGTAANPAAVANGIAVTATLATVGSGLIAAPIANQIICNRGSQQLYERAIKMCKKVVRDNMTIAYEVFYQEILYNLTLQGYSFSDDFNDRLQQKVNFYNDVGKIKTKGESEIEEPNISSLDYRLYTNYQNIRNILISTIKGSIYDYLDYVSKPGSKSILIRDDSYHNYAIFSNNTEQDVSNYVQTLRFSDGKIFIRLCQDNKLSNWVRSDFMSLKQKSYYISKGHLDWIPLPTMYTFDSKELSEINPYEEIICYIQNYKIYGLPKTIPFGDSNTLYCSTFFDGSSLIQKLYYYAPNSSDWDSLSNESTYIYVRNGYFINAKQIYWSSWVQTLR